MVLHHEDDYWNSGNELKTNVANPEMSCTGTKTIICEYNEISSSAKVTSWHLWG